VEGIHLVEEALSSGWNMEAVLMTEAFVKKSEARNVLHKIEQNNCNIFFVKEKELIALADTVTPQGIIGVVHKRSMAVDDLFNKLPQEFIVVALDNISDPGNVGTILRTCDWFGVDAVLMSSDTAELYNPKVVRASMGALFHLLTADNADLIDVLLKMKRKNAVIVSTGVKVGKSLQFLERHKRIVLVLGNEVQGVSKETQKLADETVTIPKYGKAESLNVGIACGMIVGYLRVKNNKIQIKNS
jgi:TrmH family RNA methyltransferase